MIPSDNILPEMNHVLQTASRPHYFSSVLETKFKVNYPTSLDEQKRIVALLDEAFESLDHARVNAEINLADARELFTSLSEQLLFEGDLERRTGKLSELFGPVSTGPFGSLLHQSDYVEDQVPIVNPAHIRDGKINPDWRKTVSADAAARLSAYVLRRNDIVIGRRGEMGRCAVVGEEEDGWLCGTGSFIVRPKQDAVSEFVARVLRSRNAVRQLEAISSGATVKNIGNRDLGNFLISLPSLDDQMTILAKVKDAESEFQLLCGCIIGQMDDLVTLRSSLLQKAFSGELT